MWPPGAGLRCEVLFGHRRHRSICDKCHLGVHRVQNQTSAKMRPYNASRRPVGSHDCSGCQLFLAGGRGVGGQDLTPSREPFVVVDGGSFYDAQGWRRACPLQSRSVRLAYTTINGNLRIMVEPKGHRKRPPPGFAAPRRRRRIVAPCTNSTSSPAIDGSAKRAAQKPARDSRLGAKRIHQPNRVAMSTMADRVTFERFRNTRRPAAQDGDENHRRSAATRSMATTHQR